MMVLLNAARRLPAVMSLAALFLLGACSGAVPTSGPAASLITQYGAVGDGQTLNTRALQAAIDQLSAAGGGTLRFPKGVFVSGALFLKPRVNIALDQGAVLQGSTAVSDYPRMNTRIEGHMEPWLPALLNADGIDHLRLSGPGTLDGHGAPFWDAFWQRRKENRHCTNLEVPRPRLVFFQNCRDLQISGVEFKDSGFWNLHLYRCQDALLERLNIHAAQGTGKRAPSSDGMDLDSCQRITVRDCTFAVQDDCIALKGTKGPFALADPSSPPVEHIRISGCTYNEGGGGVTCGSEATVVRDVVLEHCTINGSMALVHLKLRPDTPQHYEDFHCRDIVMHNGRIFEVSPWSQFFDLKGQSPPHSTVTNITVSGVTGNAESMGKIQPGKQATISNVVLENVDLKLKSDQFDATGVENLQVRNVAVNGKPWAVK